MAGAAPSADPPAPNWMATGSSCLGRPLSGRPASVIAAGMARRPAVLPDSLGVPPSAGPALPMPASPVPLGGPNTPAGELPGDVSPEVAAGRHPPGREPSLLACWESSARLEDVSPGPPTWACATARLPALSETSPRISRRRKLASGHHVAWPAQPWLAPENASPCSGTDCQGCSGPVRYWSRKLWASRFGSSMVQRAHTSPDDFCPASRRSTGGVVSTSTRSPGRSVGGAPTGSPRRTVWSTNQYTPSLAARKRKTVAVGSTRPARRQVAPASSDT